MKKLKPSELTSQLAQVWIDVALSLGFETEELAIEDAMLDLLAKLKEKNMKLSIYSVTDAEYKVTLTYDLGKVLVVDNEEPTNNRNGEML